jgi:hypothetical protein
MYVIVRLNIQKSWMDAHRNTTNDFQVFTCMLQQIMSGFVSSILFHKYLYVSLIAMFLQTLMVLVRRSNPAWLFCYVDKQALFISKYLRPEDIHSWQGSVLPVTTEAETYTERHSLSGIHEDAHRILE